jgi:hypothetical protein
MIALFLEKSDKVRLSKIWRGGLGGWQGLGFNQLLTLDFDFDFKIYILKINHH